MFLKLKKVKKANGQRRFDAHKVNKCLFQRQQHLCFDLIMMFVERRNVIVFNFFQYEKHFGAVFSVQMSIEIASYS